MAPKILRPPIALAIILCVVPDVFAAPAAKPKIEKVKNDEATRVTVAVEDALQRHAADAHRCLELAVADTLDVAGKVEIAVTLGDGGSVKQARLVAKAETVPASLADCIVAAARGWRIDGIEVGSEVVLPLSFSAPANQFAIKAEDAPERGPKARGKQATPFSVRILADENNVRAREMAITLLTVSASNRVSMTRHPDSDKTLVVTKGRMRILGPAGMTPIIVGENQAIFIPRGFPHIIENSGRQLPVQMLQVFSPPGPEKVYRDPTNVAARAAFEVVRDPRLKVPPGRGLVAATSSNGSVTGKDAKMSARVLLDEKTTGSASIGVAMLEFAPGAEVARHAHDGSAEFLYVVSGKGTVEVGSEKIPFAAGHALHLPRGQPHVLHIGGEKTMLVQMFSPAGPEQAPKADAKTAAKPAAKPDTKTR